MIVSKIGKWASLLLLPLVAVILYSSTKAYLLNDTPIWSFEITIFLYGVFFMMGSAYCHQQRKHVAVEALTAYVSPQWQKRLFIFSEIVVLFALLVIIWVSIPVAYRSTLMVERSTHQTPFNPPIWWYRWIIPASCALMSYQSIQNILGALSGKKTDKEQVEVKEGIYNG